MILYVHMYINHPFHTFITIVLVHDDKLGRKFRVFAAENLKILFFFVLSIYDQLAPFLSVEKILVEVMGLQSI